MTGSFKRTATQLFAGVLLLALSTSAPALSQELRIGLLAPRTGIFTQLGTDMVNGFQMNLDEHDGKLGGAKVTFIVEDDQGKPDVDVTKAKKLMHPMQGMIGLISDLFRNQSQAERPPSQGGDAMKNG
jgi:branched-chain amino acid transport system substrate-binding protein